MGDRAGDARSSILLYLATTTMNTAVQRIRRHPIKLAIGLLALVCLGSLLRRPIADLVEEARVEVPDGVEMIFWEDQEWSPPNDQSRLTIWADGRSEILLSQASGPYGPPLKDGWTVASERRNPKFGHFHSVLRRENPLPKDEAQRRFQAALAAGICDLKTFKVTYCDGGGTLVGVQINGTTEQTLIPYFYSRVKLSDLVSDDPGSKGSLNYRRYEAVTKVMGDFDRNPREQVGGPGKPAFDVAELDRALAEYTELIRSEPTNRNAYEERIKIYEIKGDYDLVLEDLAQMADRFSSVPSVTAILRKRARILAEHMKDSDAAIAELDKAARLNSGAFSDEAADTYLDRGDMLFRKLQYDRALSDFTASIESRQEATWGWCRAHLRCGDVWYVQKEYGRALEEYEQARKFFPRMPEALVRLAWIQATCPEERFRNATAAFWKSQTLITVGPKHWAENVDGKAQTNTVRAAVLTELAHSKAAQSERELAKALGIKDASFVARLRETLAAYKSAKPSRYEPPSWIDWGFSELMK